MEQTYEAMFIVDPTIAAKEWNRVTEELEKTLTRYDTKIINLRKWGERKLGFPIKKHNRGTYVLTYFRGPKEAVNSIRADLQLSEIVLRFLILSHEGEITIPEPRTFEKVGPPESADAGRRPPRRRS